jgi:hypothetical protein
MRRSIPILLLSCLFAANVWGAGKSEPKFRGVEVRHFNGNEGVELTAEFYDFLYAAMKAELQKTKLFAQIIGEGEAVDASDAPLTILIEGDVLEYKKGSAVKDALIGFGVGRRSLVSRVRIARMSDKTIVLDKEIKVKARPRWDNKRLASSLAKNIAKECKSKLKK